eukprot:5342757-Amphidinium_carterae.1
MAAHKVGTWRIRGDQVKASAMKHNRVSKQITIINANVSWKSFKLMGVKVHCCTGEGPDVDASRVRFARPGL